MSGADCSEPLPGGQGSLARVEKAAKITSRFSPHRPAEVRPIPGPERVSNPMIVQPTAQPIAAVEARWLALGVFQDEPRPRIRPGDAARRPGRAVTRGEGVARQPWRRDSAPGARRPGGGLRARLRPRQARASSTPGPPSPPAFERAIAEAAGRNVFLDDSRIRFDRIRSACAIALHMHQPLTPTGGDDLHTAALIGNLQTMAEHPGVGDNHNAPPSAGAMRAWASFFPRCSPRAWNRGSCSNTPARLLHGLRTWARTT